MMDPWVNDDAGPGDLIDPMPYDGTMAVGALALLASILALVVLGLQGVLQ